MNTTRVCPGCHAPLPPDAPEGLCPQCLVHEGIDSGHPPAGEKPTTVDAVQNESPDPPKAPAPSVNSLAQHFPQLDILEFLGQGGMGAVYKARQPGLDRLVALKLLPAEAGQDANFAQRFAQEARSLARLNHPCIVTVHDFGCAGPYYYLLMEYVDGANIRQMLRAGRISPKEALGIVPQVCQALQYAHEEGVVHRDIKPENILVDHRGRVKIADFGLARLLGRPPAEDRLTQLGAVMGTPHYMAPEQLDRPLEVDHRADIYSVGVVFYEMLTGELPIGRFAPPSQKVQVDVRLDEIVMRTLENDPERRYQYVEELKTAVETILGMTGSLPGRLRFAFGMDFRTKTTLWGLPLLHVASGTDPVTGKQRVAKGIIALGDVAKGGIAIGGAAVGVFAFGGVSVGVFPIGGLSLGLVAMGGLGLSLLVSFAGLAVGPVAMGGCAIGYLAWGGYVLAPERVPGSFLDRVALAVFEAVNQPWMFITFFVLLILGTAASMLVPILVQKYAEAREKTPTTSARR